MTHTKRSCPVTQSHYGDVLRETTVSQKVIHNEVWTSAKISQKDLWKIEQHIKKKISFTTYILNIATAQLLSSPVALGKRSLNPRSSHLSSHLISQCTRFSSTNNSDFLCRGSQPSWCGSSQFSPFLDPGLAGKPVLRQHSPP